MHIPGTRFWRRFKPDDLSEEDAELREVFVRSGFRVAAAFALLFGMAFCALWWSGAAVRFGAARAADQAMPTWRITGTVRSAITHQPIPWAAVQDDPAGRPPFYSTEGGYDGSFNLLTLAEPHRIQVSARGYRTSILQIGRTWFLWLPHGQEARNIELQPE